MAKVTSRLPVRSLLALAIAASVQAAETGTPIAGDASAALSSAPTDAGLRAELQGRWAEAAAIYRRMLAARPDQPAIWERLSDIYATRLSSPSDALDALRQAVRHAPSDARLQHKLSQAAAVAGQPAAAMEAIERAVQLDPDNLEYLRARATLAAWSGNHAVALESLERVLAATPDDIKARLDAARLAVLAAQPDAAAGHYRRYLLQRPEDREALLDYMAFEAGRGNAEAVRAHDRAYRQRFGASKEYWLRLAELFEEAHDAGASLAALDEAARMAPDDHALWYRLAQGYSAEERVEPAWAAIEHALARAPDNLDYLRLRAGIAAWRGDYPAAIQTHERILALAPGDPSSLLGKARVSYWSGQLRVAERLYDEYLAAQPDVAVAWLERATVQAEQGDSARAMDMLEAYRERFGDSEAYRRQKARVLAWAVRPQAALDVLATLDPLPSDDHELIYTRTVALHYARRPRETLESLQALEALRPDAPEVVSLGRFVRAPLRSHLAFGFSQSSGSDDVSARQARLRAEFAVSPETRLRAGAERQRVEADTGSGFERPDGGTALSYNRAWLGLGHRFSSRVATDLLAGRSRFEGDSRTTYLFGMDLDPGDGVSFRVSRQQDLFAASPRAVDLGIERRANVVAVNWAPDLRHTFVGRLGYDTFSDGNDRWELELSPRRAVVRDERLNLDIGLSGRWFGYRRDPGNGYYAPSRYQRYAVTATGYWKIDGDNGLSLSASVGPYKDDRMDGFRAGGDIAVAGYFGITRDFHLDVRLAKSHYGGGAAGGYRSRSFDINLTYRF